ncbi:MAG TPA: hypothetical protein PLJ60_13825 [Chryseolinea sp.]|nr:hypothetical protein [Chryseolinea sp.]HPM31409.1 hypothetical protein [Chryseolinea sp.]
MNIEKQEKVKHFSKYIFVVLIMIIASCDSSSDENPVDIGKDYFPMRKGFYQIYDVNEIIYTLGDPDTFIYQLKTVVIDSFFNTESNYTYVIHRSVRDNATEPWTYKDTWSSRVVNDRAIQAEGNIDFVKLVFPFHVGKKWNGNAFNTLGTEEYELVGSEPKIFNDVTFADCITIKQQDNEDFVVYLDQRYESYAKNVGLVHNEKTQLVYCTDTNSGCIGQQIVEEGVIYKQTILIYGVE